MVTNKEIIESNVKNYESFAITKFGHTIKRESSSRLQRWKMVKESNRGNKEVCKMMVIMNLI
jgi:hypothetical protein